MKKIGLMLVVLLLIVTSGCAPSPPSSPEEELVMYSWKLKSDTEGSESDRMSGTLNFDNDRIKLSIKKADGSSLNIDEYFELDDCRIVISSEQLGIINLDYKLSGSELELTLDNSSLHFSKCIT